MLVVPAHFFRLTVANRGSARAEKVEVIALDIYSSGKLHYRYSMNLSWSHASSNGVLDGLPLGIERFCDIGHVIEPTDKRARIGAEEPEPPMVGTAVFSIATVIRGNHLLHLLKPGNHTLIIAVVAANHRPRHYEIHIDNHDGQWTEKTADMLPHCQVSLQPIDGPPKYE
jgi:hypothetical protein